MATTRLGVSVSNTTKTKEVLIVHEKFKFRPQDQVYKKNDQAQFSAAAGGKTAGKNHS